jgi:folate-binding protein YgfZ
MLRGPDPLAFLQDTTTQDHTGQRIGEARWCCTLDPKGRVLAFLRATPIDATTVALDGEASCEAGVAWLTQIAPLSRCTIERTDDAAAPVPAERDEFTRLEAGWLRYGIDVTDADLLNDTPLLALCTSFTKGCYRGQETVAKIQNLGHARRGYARATLPGPQAPDPGTPVIAEGNAVGIVTSAASDGIRSVLIAKLPREFLGDQAEIAGHGPAQLEPITLAPDPEGPGAPPSPRPISRALGRR